MTNYVRFNLDIAWKSGDPKQFAQSRSKSHTSYAAYWPNFKELQYSKATH